jgi:hypothetical protein
MEGSVFLSQTDSRGLLYGRLSFCKQIGGGGYWYWSDILRVGQSDGYGAGEY